MSETIEILLVEDSPSDVRLTEEALKDSGIVHTLSVASDGEEAMEFLRGRIGSKLPDVILLDLNMPKKNGHAVLAEIKEEAKLVHIPVILLTVSQQEHDVMEALRLKMNYYLAKPVAADKLKVLLNAIFELHSQHKTMPPKTSPESEDLHVRLVLAGNPHTIPSILRKLAAESNARIRCRIAENPNTPPDVLTDLAGDESPDVRLSVGENPKTPKEILTTLSKDKSDDVRLGLAENPNIPSEILEVLASDENIYIASTAAKTLAR